MAKASINIPRTFFVWVFLSDKPKSIQHQKRQTKNGAKANI